MLLLAQLSLLYEPRTLECREFEGKRRCHKNCVVHRDSETLSHHWSSQSFPSLNLREKTVLLTFLTLPSQLGWGAREGLGFGLQGIWNSCYILKYLSRKKYATTLNIKCVSFFLLIYVIINL